MVAEAGVDERFTTASWAEDSPRWAPLPAPSRCAVALLIALLALYLSILERRWPIPSALRRIGDRRHGVVLTVVFEFVFGHWVNRKSRLGDL